MIDSKGLFTYKIHKYMQMLNFILLFQWKLLDKNFLQLYNPPLAISLLLDAVVLEKRLNN